MTAFAIRMVVGAEERIFRFHRRQISVGSGTDNDLVLPDKSVAEKHAVIFAHDSGDFRIVSSNVVLVLVNDRNSGSEKELYDGDVITIGRYSLTILEGAPPDEEAAFLDALRRTPADDDVRVVYSDWLEEHGRVNEARFIRMQLELATMDPEAEKIDFREHMHTLGILAEGMSLAWRRLVARPPIENCEIRFEVQCPMKWDRLATTKLPNQRFCGVCEKNVHYAPTIEDARHLALAGECVVVDIVRHRRDDDLKEQRDYERLGGIISPGF